MRWFQPRDQWSKWAGPWALQAVVVNRDDDGEGTNGPSDGSTMTISQDRVSIGTGSPTRNVARTPATLGTSLVVALGIAIATSYAFVASDPYLALPDATVLAARGQDVVSVLVAGLLVALVLPPRISQLRLLLWVGLLAYIVYSYGIYVIGVPMNRVFLVYVVLEMVAGAALLNGLLRLATLQWPDTASRRLRLGTGWMLVVVALMFSGLWLSVLVPFALGGNAPSPAGAGGTPYPVFVLDLVVVLPALAVVGVLLLRRHRLGAPLAVVALVKILTLFGALWAGPAYALVTDGPVALGPDAGPSLLLLVVSAWLLRRWWGALTPTDGDNEGAGA